MSEIFSISMPSDLDEWTGKVEGSGQTMSYNSGVGPDGSVGYGSCTTTTTNDVYVYKTFTTITSSDCTFKISIRDLYDFSSSNDRSHLIFVLRTSIGNRSWIEWYRNGSGTVTIRLATDDDSSVQNNTGYYALTADVRYIQCRWHKGSSSDAYHELYFNGTLKEQKGGYTLSTNFNFDEIRVGAFTTIDANSYDTYDFDSVVFRDDGILPGPNLNIQEMITAQETEQLLVSVNGG